jgi:hypothetical protein
MNQLKKGDKGPKVKAWQYFLIGQGYNNIIADGIFGPKTEEATKDFQRKNNLVANGIVENFTYGKAMQLGFLLIKNTTDNSKESINWPPKPNFKPLTPLQIQTIFGKIEYIVDNKNSSNIIITNNWEKENLITVEISQLKNIGPYFTNKIRVHKKVANQFKELFNEWQKAKLIDRILSYDGSFNPRFIRGSSSTLSNHTYGIAFDINAKYNSLGKVPALINQEGCVRELVPIANQLGFYWGGHFSRFDGMHFEIAKIL